MKTSRRKALASGRNFRKRETSVASGTNLPAGIRWAVGFHSVLEALRAHATKIKTIILWENPSRLQSERWKELLDLAKRLKVPLQVAEKESQAYGLSAGESIAAWVEGYPRVDWEDLASERPQMVCLLDGVQDPHNLGAVLRSAWLMGVQAVFLPPDRACKITPVVSKVSCGGLERVPVEEAQFSSLVDQLTNKCGFWVYGLDGGAKKSLWDLRLPEKVAWVIGAEGSGLRKSSLGLCDELVSIPQSSSDASFNASVSASMAFSEFARAYKNTLTTP